MDRGLFGELSVQPVTFLSPCVLQYPNLATRLTHTQISFWSLNCNSACNCHWQNLWWVSTLFFAREVVQLASILWCTARSGTVSKSAAKICCVTTSRVGRVRRMNRNTQRHREARRYKHSISKVLGIWPTTLKSIPKNNPLCCIKFIKKKVFNVF